MAGHPEQETRWSCLPLANWRCSGWWPGGNSNKQIAAELGISRRTVESHRESLMRKVEIRTVAGLTRFALEHGLLDDAD